MTSVTIFLAANGNGKRERRPWRVSHKILQPYSGLTWTWEDVAKGCKFPNLTLLLVPTVIKCLMYFRRGREAEEREKYLIDSEFTPFGLFNRGGWYRWYDTVNVKTLVNLLQTVWAACTRCGHRTWAVSPSGGDESRAVWGSFPLEEKQLGFLLVKYQSGAGFL